MIQTPITDYVRELDHFAAEVRHAHKPPTGSLITWFADEPSSCAGCGEP
jgi:hypothetical protein